MNGDPQRVAVIIVNWNSGGLLARCVESLSRQTMKPARVIVVDNASSDGSADGIQKAMDGVEVLRSPRNMGFAAANNMAVNKADDCGWVALLNPDAFPEPGWLYALAGSARENPQFAFFGSRMINARDPVLVDGTGDVYHVSGLVWRRGFGERAADHAPPDGEIFSPCAAAAMYARDAFLGAEGFDESYFCYSEDVDLGFRLRLAGRKCMYVSGAVVRHMGSGLTSRHSDFTVYHGHRNLVWTFVKDMPWPLLLPYLPQHLILNVVTIIYFALKGQGALILKSKLDALKGLGVALEKRREIQKNRKIGWRDVYRALTKGFFRPYTAGRTKGE
jgi:GT2 family glycosyltransferase